MAIPASGVLDETTIREARLSPMIQAAKPKFLRPTDFNPSTTSTHEFLKNFEKCAQVNNWNYIHRIKYFHIYLQGAAYTWFTRFVDDPQSKTKTWTDIKEAFIKEFSWEDKNISAERKLRSLKQGEEEEIKEYYYRVIDILDELGKDYTERDIQLNIEIGLNMKYHNSYYLIASRHMSAEQLKDVIYRLDKQIWTVENEEKSNKRFYTDYQQPGRAQTDARRCYKCNLSANFLHNCNVTKIWYRRSPPRASKHHSSWETKCRPSSPTKIKTESWRRMKNHPLCYICGKRGHLSYFCRTIVSSIRRKRCHVCNRIGHLARTCWNRANIGSRTKNHGPKNVNFPHQFQDFKLSTVYKTQSKSPWNSANQGTRAWSPSSQNFTRNKPSFGTWKRNSRRRSRLLQQGIVFNSKGRFPDRSIFPEEQQGNIYEDLQNNTDPVFFIDTHESGSP